MGRLFQSQHCLALKVLEPDSAVKIQFLITIPPIVGTVMQETDSAMKDKNGGYYLFLEIYHST